MAAQFEQFRAKMSPTSYLSIPSPEKFRRRGTSLSEGHDRYVSVGGFVNIQDLTRDHEANKANKSKQQYSLFGSVSPRSRTSRASSTSEDIESQDWDSVPTTPYRVESWSTSETPRTPFAGPEQTSHFHNHYHKANNITPSPISRYNRVGQDPHSNLSPRSAQLPKKPLPLEPPGAPTRARVDRDLCMPVELAGSLLLPSQGFPQSCPPEKPPHVSERSHSAPAALRSPILLPTIPEKFSSPTARNTSDADCSSLSSMSATDNLDMPKPFRQRDALRSTSTLDQSAHGTLPVRNSSLNSRIGPPRCNPPPIPLSRMSLEELMQILPSLDAAIIAHDWIPCVQKRHQEVKSLLQKIERVPASEPFDILNKGLEDFFFLSQDLAKSYRQVLDHAKELQDVDLQKKDADIDEANTQESVAKLDLAHCISKHQATCESYERDLEELKDLIRRAFGILGAFINEHLAEAMKHAPPQQVQQVLAILNIGSKLKGLPVRYVSSDLYHNTHKELREANHEKHELQKICSEQMVTIKDHSRELDQYIARIAKVTNMVQEKERENRKLKVQNKELELMVEAHKNAARVDQQSKLDQEQFQRATSGARPGNASAEGEIRARDAEIANLRRKLEGAVNREKELQIQLRSLLQSSQYESVPQRTSRLKRLLTGGPRGSPTSPGLPMTTSMLNLSHSIVTPFEKESRQIVVPPSPPRSGRTSPSLAGLCGPTVVDHLELPPPHINHSRTQSSVEFGPRLREGIHYSLDRDIDSAVSGRFHHMPSNVRSTAPGSRPQTPKNISDASYDPTPDFGRPRFNPAPEISNLDRKPQVHAEFDEQPPANHTRVLSGITEVTEDDGSVKRISSSPESEDRRMYHDSMHALGRLQNQY